MFIVTEYAALSPNMCLGTQNKHLVKSAHLRAHILHTCKEKPKLQSSWTVLYYVKGLNKIKIINLIEKYVNNRGIHNAL